jgi:hypothetical protein
MTVRRNAAIVHHDRAAQRENANARMREWAN